MIIVDLRNSKEGWSDSSDLWIVSDSTADFTAFRQLISDIVCSTTEMVSLRSQTHVFELRTPITEVELIATQQNNAGVHRGDGGAKIVWESTQEEWKFTLAKMDELMRGQGHQYFDYDKLTIIVSYMEGLTARLRAEQISGS